MPESFGTEEVHQFVGMVQLNAIPHSPKFGIITLVRQRVFYCGFFFTTFLQLFLFVGYTTILFVASVCAGHVIEACTHSLASDCSHFARFGKRRFGCDCSVAIFVTLDAGEVMRNLTIAGYNFVHVVETIDNPARSLDVWVDWFFRKKFTVFLFQPEFVKAKSGRAIQPHKMVASQKNECFCSRLCGLLGRVYQISHFWNDSFWSSNDEVVVVVQLTLFVCLFAHTVAVYGRRHCCHRQHWSFVSRFVFSLLSGRRLYQKEEYGVVPSLVHSRQATRCWFGATDHSLQRVRRRWEKVCVFVPRATIVSRTCCWTVPRSGQSALEVCRFCYRQNQNSILLATLAWLCLNRRCKCLKISCSCWPKSWLTKTQ